MTAATAKPLEARIRQIVELRRLAAEVDAIRGRRLLLLARELRLELDDGIPKLPAARALGVSVKALDRWIATGDVPSLRRPGSGRSQVETDSVLDLVEEVTRLHEEGVVSGVIARALERLRDTGRLRPKLRPNEAPADLRRRYGETTPAERLRAAAELSYVQTRLVAAGKLVRAANESRGSGIGTS
jgi:hypothetical protein